MYYYRPRLYDGRLAPFAWQIRLCFLIFNWPLENDTSRIRRRFDKLLVITSFILMLLCNAAELSYVFSQIEDINIMMDAVAPYLVNTECIPRMYNIAFRKDEFKKLLQEFYTKIYIEREYNDEMHREIKRSMLPTVLYSYSYVVTLLGYLAVPVIGFFRNQRILPFKIVVPFDYTSLTIYIPMLCISVWCVIAVVVCIVSECNLLATIIVHLNARYLLLQQDCQKLHESLMQSCRSEHILREFHQGLLRIIQRNVELNEFAAKLQAEYSFRVFMMMAMSSIMLCVLGFMMVTTGMSSKNIPYVTWFVAKILELLVFGQLGEKLITTTNEMSSMYYMSNWENVVLQSSNSVENTQLMKLILVAMEVNQKPMYVTGLNFFNISLGTVVSILQGAFSYFSCLYAFH